MKETKSAHLGNGENVEEAIRSLEVSNLVSEVSTLSAVRSALVAQQQEMGKTKGLLWTEEI